MNVSLATSLHLDHSALTPDSAPGEALRMQEFVPVGLLSLKAAADAAGVGDGVRVVELNGAINRGEIVNDELFYERLAALVLRRDDEVVGLMTDADSLHHTILLAEEIKRRSSNMRVWLGGPAASPLARDVLEAFPFVDAVVRGEGEATFVELISTIEEGGVPAKVLGLTWRRNGQIVENPPRPLETDLDSLPVPAYAAYDMPATAALYLDVGRGCPFKCAFCATAPFWERAYRMKSIDRIVSEMTVLRDVYGRSHLNFSHDIFTCNAKWTHRFCQRLIDEPIGVTWTCSTRTDIISPDLLEHMAAAGCVEIYFGIESGSPAIQREICKNLDLDWSRKIIGATAAVGIRPIFGFIVGYPFETRETLNDTLRRYFEFFRAGGARGHLFTLCPFAEAPMYAAYGKTARRPARDFGLPLVAAAVAPGRALKSGHRRIFSSSYRYETPELEDRLVDGSEELSAALTVLKPLMVRVVELYDTPLEWYARWIVWIEKRNESRRTGTWSPHLGDLEDVLDFVRSELERLEVADGTLRELVRYEALKLEARWLPAPAEAVPAADARAASRLDPDTVLVRSCPYLLERFRHDLRSVIAGERSMPGDRDRWILVAKISLPELTTMEVSDLARRLLEHSETPRSIAELRSLVGANGDARDGALVATATQLVEHGLLQVVAA